MTKIIMHGCNGRMGRVIADLVKEDPDAEIVAGIDIAESEAAFPVFTDINACDVRQMLSLIFHHLRPSNHFLLLQRQRLFRWFSAQQAFLQSSLTGSERLAQR